MQYSQLDSHFVVQFDRFTIGTSHGTIRDVMGHPIKARSGQDRKVIRQTGGRIPKTEYSKRTVYKRTTGHTKTSQDAMNMPKAILCISSDGRETQVDKTRNVKPG